MKFDGQWSDEDLARDWVRRFSSARRRIVSIGNPNGDAASSKRIDEETYWAFDVLHDLELRDPAHAWAIVLLILRLAPEDEGVRDNLAAGPVERLLTHHGGAAIKWVEDEARRNPRFKDLLIGVWRSGISDLIWQRIERAASKD